MTVTGQETNASHTPGPWSCAQVWRGPETKVHADFKGRRVALAEVFTMHQVGEKEANAHLIAAAPELLAVCKEVLAKADLCDCGETDCATTRLRNAIANAEGRS